ncbi:MAG TPA: cytochrome c3 family protein, partial [Candidatus Methylomirabilis sp.]|nr:cytochrome c3 family protein [Candidatus Methylomirabilis sp.]
LLMAILAGAAFAAWADTASLTLEDAPEEIVLQVYPKRQVTFDHQGHAKRIGKCQVCHHNPDSEKCSDCHGAKRDGKTPSFREAMHYKCKNCHMRVNKKVKGACQECHPNVRSSK